MTKKISLNEANYIVGIDLNLDEAIVSYLDQKTLEPVIYDMSGGYGQSAIPLAMLYIYEEKEWLVGDPVFLNKNQEGTLFVGKLLDLVLQRNTLTVDKHQYTPEKIFILFINKILESFIQMNPKAKIIDVVISFPDDMFEDIVKILNQDNKTFNQFKYNLRFVHATEALIKFMQFNKVPFDRQKIVLYYEYGQFKTTFINKNVDEIQIILDKMDETLSLMTVQDRIGKNIASLYLEHVKKNTLSEEDELNLSVLIQYQLPWVFRKHGLKQDMKIYFNFAYPPFQKILSYRQMEAALFPFEEKLREFIKHYNLVDNEVILIGPGYKMQWPISIVKEFVKPLEMSPLESIAKGCCLLAANKIIDLPGWPVKLMQYQKKQVGILTGKNKDQFTPLIEGSNFLIIDFEGSDESRLPIYLKDPSTHLLTVINEVLLNQKLRDSILRINLKVNFIEEDMQIGIEYLPL